MLELNKLTSEYIETEDRFRLTGEDHGGDALCLWLTQRLAIRLISHVIERLAASSPEAVQNPSRDRDTEALLQSHAQESAKNDLVPQDAVVGSSSTRNMLVTEVDINLAENGQMGFVFKDGISESVALGFEPQQLRQWLIIIHTQWLTALWPASIWPEWISGQPDGQEVAESNRGGRSPVH